MSKHTESLSAVNKQERGLTPMVTMKFLLSSVWFILAMTVISVINDDTNGNGLKDCKEIACSPTQSLVISLGDNKHSWGVNVTMSSRYHEGIWAKPTITIEKTYSLLFDTRLLSLNKAYFVGVNRQRYFVTIDRTELKSTSVSVGKPPFPPAWVGKVWFRIFQLDGGRFVMSATKSDGDATFFNLGEHQQFVAEGNVELLIAPDNWYCASACFAGCLPLSTDLQHAGESKCSRKLINYPQGIVGSRFSEQLRTAWRQW